MQRKVYWGVAIGGPVVLALAWALLTPGGIVGALAGVCILIGVVTVFLGIGFGGGMDTAMDHMLPGANVQRMAETGMKGDKVHTRQHRFPGLRRIAIGLAYVAVGALLWQLR